MSRIDESLRKPFFWAALIVMALAFLTDIGSKFLLGGKGEVQGMGIPYTALVDGLLLYIMVTTGLSLIVPASIQGKIQGVSSFIVSLVVIILGIFMILAAIVLLILMISLLLAAPFGTIIYFAVYGDFPKTAAAATLSSTMFLKILCAILLVLANQRFLKNKGLIFLIVTSLLCGIIVSFLHGFVPTPLVSITDALAAIIVGILGVIWALFFLIFSIPALIRAIREIL